MRKIIVCVVSVLALGAVVFFFWGKRKKDTAEEPVGI